MVDTVVARLGGLDIAVNNAGVNFNNAAEDTPESEWDTTFAVNTKGVFLCCQVCQGLLAMLGSEDFLSCRTCCLGTAKSGGFHCMRRAQHSTIHACGYVAALSLYSISTLQLPSSKKLL